MQDQDTMADGRCLVVALHDVHPGSREAYEALLAELGEWGIGRVVLLVVPRMGGGPPFTKDGAFVEWLRRLASAGHELCCHGYTHRDEHGPYSCPWEWALARLYTDGEGEFYRIPSEAGLRRVAEGLALFRSADLPVCGFVAPAWLLARRVRDGLSEFGVVYTTTLCTVQRLNPFARLWAPALVHSSRSAWRRAVSLVYIRRRLAVARHARILRLAVHPEDLRHGAIRAAVLRHAAEAARDRLVTTYRDLRFLGASAS